MRDSVNSSVKSTIKNLVLVFLCAALTGCMSFSDRELRPVANSIRQQLPDLRLKKEFAVSIGGAMFNFLDVITFNEADLSELDSVQIAVYDVSPRYGKVDFSELNFEQTLRAKNRHLQWETIVRVREDHQQIWVLVGLDIEKNSLEAVSIFALSESELVLVNVDGEFNKLLEFAMAPAEGHRGAVKSS